jgi:hypothetical protein
MLNTYLPVFDANDSRALSARANRNFRDLNAVGERRRRRTRRAARRSAR